MKTAHNYYQQNDRTRLDFTAKKRARSSTYRYVRTRTASGAVSSQRTGTHIEKEKRLEDARALGGRLLTPE